MATMRQDERLPLIRESGSLAQAALRYGLLIRASGGSCRAYGWEKAWGPEDSKTAAEAQRRCTEAIARCFAHKVANRRAHQEFSRSLHIRCEAGWWVRTPELSGACPTTPSARELRLLREIFLIAQPPLLARRGDLRLMCKAFPR